MNDREYCPNCGGDGSSKSPFDSLCPSVWAHHYLNAPFGYLRRQQSEETEPTQSDVCECGHVSRDHASQEWGYACAHLSCPCPAFCADGAR